MKNKLTLFVVEPDGSGGLIHYIYQLCTALALQGADVTLITATDYELDRLPHNFKVMKFLHLWKRFDDDTGSQNASRRLFIKIRRAFRALRWIMAWANLTMFIIHSKPDLIQFSKMYFAFDSWFISLLRKYGFVLTQICHEFEEREGQGHLEALLLGVDRNVYTNFSAIFFHAQENRSRFLSIYPSVSMACTYIIPHGNSGWLLNFKTQLEDVERLKAQYKINEGEPIILFFGLLSPSKGLEDLIEAFAIVRKSCTAKLLIVGYPTKYIDMHALTARVVELGIEDRVVFATRYVPVEEIGIIIRLATLLVYPYRSSTQSGALQAAYIFGKPVIATRIGGLPEAVEDEKNGFLVPPQSPSDLAEKMILLINNHVIAENMGRHSKYLSETRFSWHVIARQILEIYQEIILK